MSTNTDRQVTVPYLGQVFAQAAESVQGVGTLGHMLAGAVQIGNPLENALLSFTEVCYMRLLLLETSADSCPTLTLPSVPRFVNLHRCPSLWLCHKTDFSGLSLEFSASCGM